VPAAGALDRRDEPPALTRDKGLPAPSRQRLDNLNRAALDATAVERGENLQDGRQIR
jgi:hypothetical protein